MFFQMNISTYTDIGRRHKFSFPSLGVVRVVQQPDSFKVLNGQNGLLPERSHSQVSGIAVTVEQMARVVVTLVTVGASLADR